MMQYKALNTLQMASQKTFYLSDWQRPAKAQIISKLSNYSDADTHISVIRQNPLNSKRNSHSKASSNLIHKYCIDFNPRNHISQKNTINVKRERTLPLLIPKISVSRYKTQILKKEQCQKKGQRSNLLENIKVCSLTKIIQTECQKRQSKEFRRQLRVSRRNNEADYKFRRHKTLKARSKRSLVWNCKNIGKTDSCTKMQNQLQKEVGNCQDRVRIMVNKDRFCN